MTHNAATLLPDSCSPMADDAFLNTKGGPIHTPDIGAIDEGLVSISEMKSHT